MQEKPSNVTIRLKRGSWEIEITCPEDKIQQAVESVLAGMSSREKEAPNLVQLGVDERRFETCRGLLISLWKEGWFTSARSLSDVHEEMSRRGYHYDRTAVAHALVDLVREGILFREGTMRNYRYIQKYPFKEANTT